MGLLNKIFGKSESDLQIDNSTSEQFPLSFVDCIEMVHAWKTQIILDPDAMFHQDDSLSAAMNSQVSCPYCSHEMKFREAVINSGAALKVRCPACLTEPALHTDHEFA